MPFCHLNFDFISTNPIKIREESLKEISSLLKLFMLETNFLFEPGSVAYEEFREGIKCNVLNLGDMVAIIPPKLQELSQNQITTVVNLKEKLDILNLNEKEKIIRALEWYSRGLKKRQN